MTMGTNRLEAFSDGVLAIIITIMVLELKAPEAADLHSLMPLIPTISSYTISFIYLGIYWNNHHHLFKATEKVNGNILWANLHLLFWLSLVPFVTSWVGEHHLAAVPIATYGFVLLMSAIAYFILQGFILRSHPDDFVLRKAIGNDAKGKISVILYVLALILAFVNTWFAISGYILVAMIWFIPDSRIEKSISEK